MRNLLSTLLVLLLVGPRTQADGGHGPEIVPEVLKKYFGSFRTKVYNGVENHYSNHYFLPSVNTEPSVKLRQLDGSVFRTVNFNFEVPIETSPGSIFLKFIFPEMPIQGMRIIESGENVELMYDGPIVELQVDESDNAVWVACSAQYDVRILKLDERLLQIEFEKSAKLPCVSERHLITVERVDLYSERAATSSFFAKSKM